MTIALPRPRERVARHFDLSLPVLVLLALFLCGLVVLPLGWLAWYSVTDKNGALTLGNFVSMLEYPVYLRSIWNSLASMMLSIPKTRSLGRLPSRVEANSADSVRPGKAWGGRLIRAGPGLRGLDTFNLSS